MINLLIEKMIKKRLAVIQQSNRSGDPVAPMIRLRGSQQIGVDV
jgi:hypothetical protein